MFTSAVKELNPVCFPDFTGERIYMQKFYKEEGLPKHLSRWQPTVDQMLLQVDTDKPIFLMVDQGTVKPNTSHRRPGPHIDGYWIEELQAHGGSSGGHRFNNDTEILITKNGYWDTGPSWKTANLSEPESIILASDVAGCKAYVGDWHGEIGEGGDCTDICFKDLSEFTMKPNNAYMGNVSFVHESIPLPFETQRTLVRLNLKGI